MRPLAPAWQFVLVVVFGLVVGVLCRLLRPIWAALATALLCGAWLWVARERFVDASVWLPSVLPVGVQAPLALFAGVWLHYRDTVRERHWSSAHSATTFPAASSTRSRAIAGR